MVLVEVVRYVGVGAAFVGSVVTAPSGTRLLVEDIANALRAGWQTILHNIPWRHRSIAGQFPGAVGTAHGSAHFHGYAEGWAGMPDGPVSEQVKALELRTEILGDRIRQLRKEHGELIQGVRDQLTAVISDHRDALEKVRKLHEEREEQGARIDAAGLPLIGLGIVLSGLPDQAVRHVSVSSLLLAITAVAMLHALVRGRRNSKE